jgi:hypothetical protein
MLPDNNDNLYARSGETVTVEITVRNPDGSLMSLIGATAKMGILIESTITVKDCTISGSIVFGTLTSEETADLDGNYKYEIVLKTALNEIRSLAHGILVITPAFVDDIFPEEPTP